MTSKVDISRNGQVVQLQNIRDRFEPLQEVTNDVEVGAELDQRSTGEHPQRAHAERTVPELVQVAHDQEKILRLLDRQKASSGNVHT